MTTHYMEEAEYLCDRICIIDNGKIIALGTINEVINPVKFIMRLHMNRSRIFPVY